MKSARCHGLRWLVFLVLATTVVGSQAVAAPELVRADGVYAKETRHSLADPFWGYWVEHDGPSLLGLPVSEPVKSGKEKVQYFEYGALTTRKGQVERVKAGALLKKHIKSTANTATPITDQLSAATVASTPPPAKSKPSSDLVKLIKAYVSKHGGSDRFGNSLGSPVVDGDTVTQWYTYGRVNVVSSSKPVAHQSKIGKELAQAIGVKMDQVNRGGLPSLDIKRPGANYFVGDGTVPEAADAFEPLRVAIPSIGVDAAIEQIGIVAGVMGIPVDAWKVGWYHQLSPPGLTGNAVMSGHVDWWGIGPTVFANLASIQAGAKIYLTDEGGEGATYAVTSVEPVSADTDAALVIAPTEAPTLTMITCTGTFNGVEYTSRLIVRATRV